MPRDHHHPCHAQQTPAHQMSLYPGQSSKQLVTMVGLALVLSVVASGMAQAGTGGTEFNAINTRIVDVLEGGGGKLMVGVAIFLGICGMVKGGPAGQTAMGVSGVGVAAAYGYPIVTSAITAIM